MVQPLLATKLYIPPAPAELVSRPRLFQQLDTGLAEGPTGFARKLTVVSAPAGFGKTTLLSEWIHRRGGTTSPLPVAWLSLDRGDNDPVRFWAYCVAALQTIPVLKEAGVGGTLLAALQSPGSAKPDTKNGFETPATEESLSREALLITLINEITAAEPIPFLFVLDDYHLIEAAVIHEALTFLIDHLPPQMHLVIGTRADPPLSIARLRGRGQLSEVRLTDLRFTADEAFEFLNRVTNLRLSADDVTALVSRTEGWIAGLQMAALSMQGPRWAQSPRDKSSFIKAFTGSDRYVLDYLVEEVLDQLPVDTQEFLLQTSIADRLTARLCDTIADREDSQALLLQLERANLFLLPLDNERRWYRYHHLFADLLRKRLHQAQPDLVPILHRRASVWNEENGLVAEAIEHALAAQALERAADLVEQAAEAIFGRSEIATFLTWVDALPNEVVCSRPSLCLYHAWALLWGGQPLDAIESRLQDAARLRDADKDTSSVHSKVATLRAFVAAWQGRVSRATELSRQALEGLPEQETFLRGIAAWNLSMSYLLMGDAQAGAQLLEEMFALSQEMGNTMMAVSALCYMAELHMSQGKLHEAWDLYQRALALATDEQGRRLPIAGTAEIGLGEVAREWNDLSTATRYLEKGIERASQRGEFSALDGYLALARTRLALGDTDGVRQAMEKAQRVAVQFDVSELDDFVVAIQQARLWLQQGQVESALRWLDTRGLTPGVPIESGADSRKRPPTDAVAETEASTSPRMLEDSDSPLEYQLRSYEYVLLARVLLAQNRPDEALPLLAAQLEAVEAWGWPRVKRTIETQNLRALAFQAKGDVPEAIRILESVLALAEPGGFVRIFVDEGEPMARLLRQALSRGIMPTYVERLLAAFGQPDGAPADEKPVAPHLPALIEPLSEREMEVLRLLSAGLSNPEIAQELYIAVSTVRSHLKSIYSKLDVHKRWDAVRLAEELDLI
jgi:LuxR family maltose regulon positive regulatory protein